MKNREVQTYVRPNGAVEVVGGLRQTEYAGELCYAVVTRGDHDVYFGSSRILFSRQVGGSRETWYIPDNYDFAEYAANLHRLGGWFNE